MTDKILGADAQVIMNKCHWCQQERATGQWRNGYWVCHVCFPESGGLVDIRKCEACGARNKKGGVINGKYICCDCNVFIGATRHPTPNKKKKKSQPVYEPVCYKADQQKEPRKKKPKRKKKEYFVVVITEISYGEL